MDAYLVLCKEGTVYPKWIPMGISKGEYDSAPHLYTDGPFSLFKELEEAEKWVADAVAHHSDSIVEYKIETMEIPKVKT